MKKLWFPKISLPSGACQQWHETVSKVDPIIWCVVAELSKPISTITILFAPHADWHMATECHQASAAIVHHMSLCSPVCISLRVRDPQDLGKTSGRLHPKTTCVALAANLPCKATRSCEECPAQDLFKNLRTLSLGDSASLYDAQLGQ